MEDTQNGTLSSLDWVKIRNPCSSTCSSLPTPYPGNRRSPWSRMGYSAHFYFLGKLKIQKPCPEKEANPGVPQGGVGRALGRRGMCRRRCSWIPGMHKRVATAQCTWLGFDCRAGCSSPHTDLHICPGFSQDRVNFFHSSHEGQSLEPCGWVQVVILYHALHHQGGEVEVRDSPGGRMTFPSVGENVVWSGRAGGCCCGFPCT